MPSFTALGYAPVFESEESQELEEFTKPEKLILLSDDELSKLSKLSDKMIEGKIPIPAGLEAEIKRVFDKIRMLAH